VEFNLHDLLEGEKSAEVRDCALDEVVSRSSSDLLLNSKRAVDSSVADHSCRQLSKLSSDGLKRAFVEEVARPSLTGSDHPRLVDEAVVTWLSIGEGRVVALNSHKPCVNLASSDHLSEVVVGYVDTLAAEPVVARVRGSFLHVLLCDQDSSSADVAACSVEAVAGDRDEAIDFSMGADLDHVGLLGHTHQGVSKDGILNRIVVDCHILGLLYVINHNQRMELMRMMLLRYQKLSFLVHVRGVKVVDREPGRHRHHVEGAAIDS